MRGVTEFCFYVGILVHIAYPVQSHGANKELLQRLLRVLTEKTNEEALRRVMLSGQDEGDGKLDVRGEDRDDGEALPRLLETLGRICNSDNFDGIPMPLKEKLEQICSVFNDDSGEEDDEEDPKPTTNPEPTEGPDSGMEKRRKPNPKKLKKQVKKAMKSLKKACKAAGKSDAGQGQARDIIEAICNALYNDNAAKSDITMGDIDTRSKEAIFEKALSALEKLCANDDVFNLKMKVDKKPVGDILDVICTIINNENEEVGPTPTGGPEPTEKPEPTEGPKPTGVPEEQIKRALNMLKKACNTIEKTNNGQGPARVVIEEICQALKGNNDDTKSTQEKRKPDDKAGRLFQDTLTALTDVCENLFLQTKRDKILGKTYDEILDIACGIIEGDDLKPTGGPNGEMEKRRRPKPSMDLKQQVKRALLMLKKACKAVEKSSNGQGPARVVVEEICVALDGVDRGEEDETEKRRSPGGIRRLFEDTLAALREVCGNDAIDSITEIDGRPVADILDVVCEILNDDSGTRPTGSPRPTGEPRPTGKPRPTGGPADKKVRFYVKVLKKIVRACSDGVTAEDSDIDDLLQSICDVLA